MIEEVVEVFVGVNVVDERSTGPGVVRYGTSYVGQVAVQSAHPVLFVEG